MIKAAWSFTSVTVLAGVIATVSAGAMAQEPPAITPSGPFCGIYSLYTALRSEGAVVVFSQLLRPEYVGSTSGSTFEELQQAARDQHMDSQLLENLSVADLQHLTCPAILHVKADYDADDYNHFLLCVPLAGGGVGLYDPPQPLVRTSGHQLAALWDGTALLVSGKPIDLTPMRRWAAARAALVVAAVLGLMGVGWWVRAGGAGRRQAGFRMARRPSLQLGLALCGASAIAAAYHLLAPEGFVAQHQAVAAINAVSFGAPVPQIDVAQANRACSEGVLFIDARGTDDYQRDHIDRAINIPPQASRFDRANIVRRYPKNAPVVVYCESAACPYAARLARHLRGEGFGNVRVLSGGWRQWQASLAPGDRPTSVARASKGGL